MIRFQLRRIDSTGDIILTVAMMTAPPMGTHLNITESPIDIPYDELEMLVAMQNIGMAAVMKAFAEVNLKDLAAKDGAGQRRIVKADATALKGLRK